MYRASTGVALFVVVLIVIAAPSGDASSSAGMNGQISYDRADPQSPDDTFVYTANSDGSHARRLTAKHTCCPSWSHDGRKLTIAAAISGDRIGTATVAADGRSYTVLRIKDPTLSVAGVAWSPDDTKLACESWDDSHPSRNGVYTLSSSDGSALKRLTSNAGGSDLPGAYSPDGKRVVFSRFDKEGRSLGLFVVNTDGSRQHRVTPAGVIMQEGNTGDWSPRGNDIVFSRKPSPTGLGSIWVIRADGSHLRQVKVKGLNCGGGFGCHGPRWSPDGKKIIFAANSAAGTNIYVADADGSGLAQITHDGRSDDPSWGTH